MDEIRTPETRKPQRRQRTKWNYKRIGVALAAALLLTITTAYGGCSLAHRLGSRSDVQEKVAKRPVEVTSSPSRVLGVTTTTEPNYLAYTVKSGDTFYSIAAKHKTTVEKIKDVNDFSGDDNSLQIGMALKIPTKEALMEPAATQKQDEKQSKENKASPIKLSAQEISRGPRDAKKVALTFDAGSASEPTREIIKALEDANVKATFFLTGKWVEENKDLAKKIADDGYPIGNHTYSHADLTKTSNNGVAYELSKTEGIIQKTTGASTKPLFRTPYGARDSRVLRVAMNSGYRSIYWTIDSLDWKSTMTADQVKNRVLSGLDNGAIVLMHCGSSQTATILPDLLKRIKERGYEIVTVPQLFE
ncbi:MAG: polysaccharide deacetylase family protein [Candidatus Aquicultor sp.]